MFSLTCTQSCAQRTDFTELRNQMTETQIIARGISDTRVLNAFYKVERHRFVLSEYLPKDCEDHLIPIHQFTHDFGKNGFRMSINSNQ